MRLFMSPEEKRARAARLEEQERARVQAEADAEKARLSAQEKARLEAQAKTDAEWAAKRAHLLNYPFDPRTEVSADAVYIAKHNSGRIVGHLWGIFVLLPVVLGVLYAIVK